MTKTILEAETRVKDMVSRAESCEDGLGFSALGNDGLVIGRAGHGEQTVLTRLENGNIFINTQNKKILEQSYVENLGINPFNEGNITISKNKISDLPDVLMKAGESTLIHPANQKALESSLIQKEPAPKALKEAAVTHDVDRTIVRPDKIRSFLFPSMQRAIGL